MIYIILVILGASFGSFAAATAWRLHEKRDFVRERSECEHCHHQLAWYDLIPVLSWLLLRGRCRYCGDRLSVQYPLVELAGAGLLVGSYAVWPYGFDAIGWVLFGIWSVIIVALMVLTIYDARWMLLPDVIVFPLIAIGIIFGLLRSIGYDGAEVLEAMGQMLLGVMSLGGLYYVLHRVSDGAWVGFGDVKLGVFMGAALGWEAALVTLVLANTIGFLVVVPGLLTKKLSRHSRVPFGPFLITGFLIAGLFYQQIISWYLGISGISSTLLM